MRKVFIIALNGLIRTARDKKALALFLLMPMLLIGILGSALKGMMTGGKINPFDVILINADAPVKPHFGKILADDVLTNDQVRKVMKVAGATDLEKAKNDVAAGKAVAVVYVPPTFTADALAGKPATIEIFSDPGRPIQSDIVTQVVRAFADAVTSGTLAGRIMAVENAQKLQGKPGSSAAQLPGQSGPSAPRTTVQSGPGQAAVPGVTEIASGARSVSAMQYYAAAMAVMFMVMTALARAKDIIRERQEGTLSRILVSPTGRGTVLAGQILGSMALVLAQFIILMLGTRFLFGVYWGEWLPVMLMGSAFALASAGIGTAAAGLLKDPRAADASVGLIGNIFAALSGGMFPIYVFPEGLKMVAKFIPNYWALQGFLDQMAGVGLTNLWLPATILALMGVATGAVGAWRLASS